MALSSAHWNDRIGVPGMTLCKRLWMISAQESWKTGRIDVLGEDLLILLDHQHLHGVGSPWKDFTISTSTASKVRRSILSSGPARCRWLVGPKRGKEARILENGVEHTLDPADAPVEVAGVIAIGTRDALRGIGDDPQADASIRAITPSDRVRSGPTSWRRSGRFRRSPGRTAGKFT